jgi:hypothetical protein
LAGGKGKEIKPYARLKDNAQSPIRKIERQRLKRAVFHAPWRGRRRYFGNA